MLGPQTAATAASWLIASVYISSVPATGQLQTKLQLAPLTIYFRLNSKKKWFYYSNGVYVYVIIMMITGSMELRILLSVFLDRSTTNHLIQCDLKQSLLFIICFFSPVVY